MVKRIILTVCGLLFCLSAASCSDTAESSSSEAVSSEPEVSSAAESSAPESTPYSPKNEVGAKLRKVYDIYSSGRYTLQCKLTGSRIKGEVDILRVVDGEDSYQLQHERLGDHGTVTVSGKSYDFDYVCGMYREIQKTPELNVVEQIVKQGVPRTSPHTKQSESGEYDTEQYTYTGDTYITVLDFYFDKYDSHLVKYDTTYSVEGQDDIVETREIIRLDKDVDTSVFNAYFADTLVNFDQTTEEQRLGFCQGLCGSWGVTSDEMYEFGISVSDLGTVDYDTLFALIHTYGKPHQRPEDDSSGESSGAADSSADIAEDSSSADTSSDTDNDDLPSEAE